MHEKLLPYTLAFLAGLTVGGFAFGQRDHAAPPNAPARERSSAPAATAASTETRLEAPSPASASAAVGERSEADALSDRRAGAGDLGPIGVEEQMAVLVARWSGLETRLAQIAQRLGTLERRVETRGADDGSAVAAERDRTEFLSTGTPEDRRDALIVVGVSEQDADEIVRRQSELDLARLDLQDRAAREGWSQTERYFDELRKLGSESVDLRREIGDETYDHFLYETGENNRVKVSSVIQGSQAEQSGLLPGDIIESYGDERVFDFGDLRRATTSGVRDELVPVTIRRGAESVDVWMTRGPIGVRLEAASSPPGG